MGRRLGSWEQLRARTPVQIAVLVALTLVEIAGIVAVGLGHRDLGRSLIGAGIVALGPFTIWMRKTAL